MKLHTLFSAATAVALGAAAAAAQPHDWQLYTDRAYGTTVAYPADVFQPAPPEPGAPGQAFVSRDGRATLGIGAWTNDAGERPGAFKDRLLSDEKYASLTYDPRGRSWFVLSGYRGSDIYYEKVMYSCGGQVVNALAVTYPEAQRAYYDPIVERMEDSFRPGGRC